jgi:hypothetical protein
LWWEYISAAGIDPDVLEAIFCGLNTAVLDFSEAGRIGSFTILQIMKRYFLAAPNVREYHVFDQ